MDCNDRIMKIAKIANKSAWISEMNEKHNICDAVCC